MFGEAKVQNSNVWKSQKPEFQCLEKPKFRIPVFGKAKKQNSNVWNSQKPESQSKELDQALLLSAHNNSEHFRFR